MKKNISRVEKLAQLKRSEGVDAFLISSPSSVTYYSGYFFYFEYGPSPFHLVPAMLLVVPQQEAALVVADNEMGQASFVDPGIKVQPYESYAFEKAPRPAESCIREVSAFIRRNGLGSARIGIEPNSLPFVVGQALKENFPSIVWVDVTGGISRMKAIKDADEIADIRRSARLSDIGQEAVFSLAGEGMSELELFSRAHHLIESSAGMRIPVMADLSSGVNTHAGGGMPTNRLIQEGDVVLSDFQACLRGYWGDSCSTLVVGRATADQKKTFKLVSEALEMGIQAMKPGVEVNKIDQLMRGHIGNYPHHSGHGVGTLYHEEPRVTPYNKTLLEPGMVIALEPAIYKEAYGVRLEHLMLVTGSGAEVLTHFEHRYGTR